MSELSRRLSGALSASGYPIEPCDNRLTPLSEKVKLLQDKGRYTRLISDLFAANDSANLRSLVLEVTFAFHFENADKPLQYEVTRRSEDATSVDFLRQITSGEELYIEMRLVQQRQALTDLFEAQLRDSHYFGTTLDGVADRAETLRLQRIILSKAINKRGKLIKFQPNTPRSCNIVAVEVSEIHLGMPDDNDCLLATYGDRSVPDFARRQIFGLFQEPRPEYPPHIHEIAETFAPFREAVHAVLFLRKIRLKSLFAFDLEYILIHNPKLMTDNQADTIGLEFKQAMDVWR